MLDKTFELSINGSTQTIRMCGARTLPPLLVVQAGPGFPLLQEVSKFQKRLDLEKEFLTCYWDQRGCGAASKRDAESVSTRQQIDDVRAVLRWLKNETGEKAVVLAISLGATFTLQAAEREPDLFAFIVAVSPDAQMRESDASVRTFLRARAARDRRLTAKLEELGEPPYLDPAKLQLRAKLLADLGCIESGRTFSALARETFFGLVGAYGLFGALTALKNMDAIQRRMLPELTTLDLIAKPLRVTVPVHSVFGELDPLVSEEMANAFAKTIATTSVRVAGAGHMVHFDHPDVVRALLTANETAAARVDEACANVERLQSQPS